MHFRLDPMHGEGHQAYAHFRVEPLDRLHQPHIALLDEVRLRQPVALVGPGQMHDKTEVAEHQPAGRLQVAVAEETLRQGLLLLRGEDGEGAYRLHIAVYVRPWGEALQSKHAG